MKIRTLVQDFPGEGRHRLFVLNNQSGDILGTVSVKCDPAMPEFCRMFVVPHCRRMKYGTALMRAVIQDAKKAKCLSLSAYVKRDNVHAQRFYKALGFIPVGKYPDGDIQIALKLNSWRLK